MVLFYLALCIAVGYFAHTRGKTGIGFFFISLILSPLISMIIVLLIKPDQKTADKLAVKDGDNRKCPYCAEIIKAEALKCRYCHSELTPPDTPEEIIMVDSHKKTMVGKYVKYE